MNKTWFTKDRKSLVIRTVRRVLGLSKPHLIGFVLAWVCANLAGAEEPTPAELDEAHRWAAGHLDLERNDLPFSFTYDGRKSRDLLQGWGRQIEHQNLKNRRTQHRLTWVDPQTGLEVSGVAVEYADFPVVEWTVYFKNTGTSNLPILEEIQALDARIPSPTEGEAVLYHWRGDANTPDSYQPLAQILGPGESKRFAPEGGRPSNGAFPYFNVRHSGGGRILAVGWPGQWQAAFTRELDGDALPLLRER